MKKTILPAREALADETRKLGRPAAVFLPKWDAETVETVLEAVSRRPHYGHELAVLLGWQEEKKDGEAPKDDPRVRKLVADLRTAGVLVVASTDTGYWCPSTRADLRAWIENRDRYIEAELDRARQLHKAGALFFPRTPKERARREYLCQRTWALPKSAKAKLHQEKRERTNRQKKENSPVAEAKRLARSWLDENAKRSESVMWNLNNGLTAEQVGKKLGLPTEEVSEICERTKSARRLLETRHRKQAPKSRKKFEWELRHGEKVTRPKTRDEIITSTPSSRHIEMPASWG
jgi:hypothetical protein